MSVTLGNLQISYDSNNGFSWDGSYIGQDGTAEVNQEISVVGFGVSHSFRTEGDGYVPGTDKIEYSTPMSSTTVAENDNTSTSINVSVSVSKFL